MQEEGKPEENEHLEVKSVDIDRLIADILNSDASVRVRALNLAMIVKEQSIVGALAAVLDDPDESVRALAALALGGYSESLSLDHLRRAMVDPSALVREFAVGGLAETTGHTAHQIVESALADPELSVRGAAIRGLANGDSHNVEILLERAGGCSQAERFLIAHALAGVDSREVHEFMQDAAEQEDLVVIAAAHPYFLERGGVSPATLVRALQAQRGSPVATRMSRAFMLSDVPELRDAGEAHFREYDSPVLQRMTDDQRVLASRAKGLQGNLGREASGATASRCDCHTDTEQERQEGNKPACSS